MERRNLWNPKKREAVSGETTSAVVLAFILSSLVALNGGFTGSDSVLTLMSSTVIEEQDDLEYIEENSIDYIEDGISEAEFASFHSCYFDKSCSDLDEMSTFGDNDITVVGSSNTNTTRFQASSTLSESSSPPVNFQLYIWRNSEGHGAPRNVRQINLRKFCSLKRFGLQVLLLWMFMCIPGNVVTFYLYHHSDDVEAAVENLTSLKCHEIRADWSETVSISKFVIEGVSISSIGVCGIAANLLSIVVLLKCKDNSNFHRLLAGLAIVDILVISDLVLEMSVLGVFMKNEPYWYILTYPYFIHPGRGIIQTAAIFMVVAVATERYRAMCHPMVHRQAYYRYILIVVVLATCLEFPRFFEVTLNDDKTRYWTTALMENPYYVQFNSYWNELLATGFIPLIALCYMNTRIFLKIKDSSRYALRFVSNRLPTNGKLDETVDNRSQPNRSHADVSPPQEAVSEDNTTMLRRSMSAHRSDAQRNKQPNHMVISGAQYVRRRKEKSTTILIAIIVVFLLCHIHRLCFRIYELAHPEKSLYEHYQKCNEQGKYHVPVAIYFLTHSHHLFLVLNSSVNFVIYCCMGRQFRKQLKKMVSKALIKIKFFV